MKTPLNYLSISFGLLVLLGACSVKNDTFLSRNSHALSTKYNILYNGQVGFDKGLLELKTNDTDNFWKRLPIEKMDIANEYSEVKKAKNPNFDLAETKATKAIQKHSMNIDGTERNYQTDEAYLLLGKARYYDQRFIPALDAFNYILYKYPSSNKIYEAKIWREKTNMRLKNDALVVTNITRLIEENQPVYKKFLLLKFRKSGLSKKLRSDANALLAESYLNLEDPYCALEKLKLAEKLSNSKYQKARYRFILGQLYQELGVKDSALYNYNLVINMNRKAEKKYVIHAQAQKSELFDFENGDTLKLVKTFADLIKDRENRPFLGILNYQMGVFYDKNDNQKQALKYYNTSLKKVNTDQYLAASNYRNIANMYFRKAKYPMAAKYFDSTLTKLKAKSRESIHIAKVRKDLDEVILYETIANKNDSIIRVFSMSKADRTAYFEDYIVKLKKQDEEKRKREEKRLAIENNIKRNNASETPSDNDPDFASTRPTPLPPSSKSIDNQSSTVFYFYNSTMVSYGKIAFKKNWGTRAANGYWRMSALSADLKKSEINGEETTNDANAIDQLKKEEINEAYTTKFYLDKVIEKKEVQDSLKKERNNAYYQLGLNYKEKFKEYQLAATKFESLLQQQPEQKLVLPSLYNLYKIYEIINPSKAIVLKNRIMTEFPDSRYAQIINKANSTGMTDDSPEAIYDSVFALNKEEKYEAILEKTNDLINQFSGNEIVSKFELLRAVTIGKLQGLTAYKAALQLVADTYPNTEEGKNAKELVTNKIPVLEKINFSTTNSYIWKILYKIPKDNEALKTEIVEKLTKYLAADGVGKFNFSIESYKENEQFVIIHGSRSEESAKELAAILKDNKELSIAIEPIFISIENYKVVQIKKNLEAYLTPKK